MTVFELFHTATWTFFIPTDFLHPQRLLSCHIRIGHYRLWGRIYRLIIVLAVIDVNIVFTVIGINIVDYFIVDYFIIDYLI